jgi:hypothetical protein
LDIIVQIDPINPYRNLKLFFLGNIQLKLKKCL